MATFRELTDEDLESLWSNSGEDDGSSSSEEEEDEFSWANNLFEEQDILPPIHHQDADTCVFDAISFSAEMEMRRVMARRVPAATTDITFNVNSFAADYERETGMILGREVGVSVHHGETTGLMLFRRDGVLARSAAWEGERRVRISRYRVHRRVTYERCTGFIMRGRPVVGVMPCHREFLTLGPGQIYEYLPLGQTYGPPTFAHAVAFVGYGTRWWRGNRRRRRRRGYLIMANSHGTQWGDNGLGKVYFDRIYVDRMYTIRATPPVDH